VAALAAAHRSDAYALPALRKVALRVQPLAHHSVGLPFLLRGAQAPAAARACDAVRCSTMTARWRSHPAAPSGCEAAVLPSGACVSLDGPLLRHHTVSN